jgi:hypothetical protein
MHATMFNNKTAKKETMHKNTKGKLKDRTCMHAYKQPCSTTTTKKTPRKKACTQTQKKVQRIHEFFMHIFQSKLVVTFKLS